MQGHGPEMEHVQPPGPGTVTVGAGPQPAAATPPAGPAPQVTFPHGWPLVGSAVPFGRDPDAFLAACQRRYGDVFRLRLPGGTRTFLMDPLDYPGYFQAKGLDFQAAVEELSCRAFGYRREHLPSPLFAELAHMLTEPLKGDALRPLTERMQQVLSERLLRTVGTGWIHDQLFRFADEHIFWASGEALFGRGFASPETHRSYQILDRYFPLLAIGVPARLLPGCVAARHILADAIAVRREGRSQLMEDRTAVVARLGLPPRETAMISVSLIWASQANTISSAFWTLLFILRDPHARAEIEAEVRGITGAAGGAAITYDMLRAMVKLDSAITEVTRLVSIPMILRQALAPVEIPLRSGRRLAVAPGEQVCIYPRLTHLDPEIFSDPYTFKFDRFLQRGAPKQFYKRGERVAFALLPFGAGQSMCPGRFFARNEFKIAVATLLTQFDIELGTTSIPELTFSRVGLGVPPPVRDVPFRLRRRS